MLAELEQRSLGGMLRFSFVSVFLPLCSLCLCGSFLFFYHLAERDLWSSHEGRAAQDAQTILDDGRWGLPRLFDGHRELQKPPLYYWLVAATAWARGGMVDAWAVRLPAAGCALLGVVALYLFSCRVGRPVAGLVAAGVLATAQHYTWLARVGRIDMPLTLAVGVALGAYYLGWRARNESTGQWWPWVLLAYTAAAVAILLKGPIGVILPGVVIIVHRLVESYLRRSGHSLPVARHRSSLWWGVPLLLALVLPWFVWAGLHTGGEFFRVFFWYHNVERGLGELGARHGNPPWFYGPRLAMDFLPWSPVLLASGWYLLRRGRWREDAEARFGLVWLLSMFLLLSCMRFKRADYVLPAYPGAALVLGCAAERWLRSAARPRLLTVAFGLSLLGCLVGWTVYIDRVLPRQEPQYEQRRFAAAIRRLVPAPQLVLFFRAESHALAFHVGRPIDTFLEW
jgi:4-amino-4-deoxy-L-arabinose transferase-like glycosyltransferase